MPILDEALDLELIDGLLHQAVSTSPAVEGVISPITHIDGHADGHFDGHADGHLDGGSAF